MGPRWCGSFGWRVNLKTEGSHLWSGCVGEASDQCFSLTFFVSPITLSLSTNQPNNQPNKVKNKKLEIKQHIWSSCTLNCIIGIFFLNTKFWEAMLIFNLLIDILYYFLLCPYFLTLPILWWSNSADIYLPAPHCKRPYWI